MIGFARYLFALSIVLTTPSLLSIKCNSNSSTEEIWGDTHIKETYTINDFLYLSDVSVEAGGKTIKTHPSITFPSGKIADGERNILNESGRYEVNYSGVSSGKTYEKKETFFVKTPYYSHGSKSSAFYGVGERATHEGLVVSLAKNETLDFNEIIDLTDITKNDELFKFYLTPSTFGAYDMNQLIFRLTDVEDPTNYFEVTLGKKAWRPDVYQGEATVYGKGDDCDRVSAESWTDQYTPNGGGSNKGYVVANGSFGASTYVTFNGIRRIVSKMNYGWKDEEHTSYGWISNDYENISTADYDATEAIITYDYDEMELGLVSMNLDFKGDRTSERTYKRVWDFNEPKLANKVSGGTGIWRGFTSGKCKLSIRAEQYVGPTANFVLTSVYGLNLKESLVEDKEGPIIDVDSSVVENNIATYRGKAGCYFKIPEALATDFYCGNTPVKALAYKNYGLSNQVNIETLDDKFYPKTSGKYTIEYSSSDYNGNKTVRCVDVFVDDKTPSDIEISFDGKIEKEAYQGRVYSLPQVTALGGVGSIDIEMSATRDGEIIEMDGGSFIPEETGSYVLSVKATDYIGQTAKLSISITVKESRDPFIFETPSLMRNYLAYGEYEVPSVKAYRYGSSGKEAIEPSVTVELTQLDEDSVSKKSELSLNPGDKFATKNLVDGSDVAFTYSFEGKVLGSYKSTAVNTVYYDEENWERVVDFKKYFIANSSYDLSYDLSNGGNGGYKFVSRGENIRASFANAVLADKFAFGFYAANTNEMDSLTIKIFDAEHLGNCVSMKMSLLPDRTFECSASGFSKNTLSTRLSGENNYVLISFDGESFTIGDGDVTLPITNFDNGKPFSSFESHKVFFDFEIDGMPLDDQIILKRIGNHTFETEYDFYDQPIEPCHDYVEPQYVILGDQGKYGSINEVASTDVVYSQDVFAPTSSSKVTLENQDGDAICDIEGNEIRRLDASVSYDFKFESTEVYTASYYVSELCDGDDYWFTQNSKSAEYPYGVIDLKKPIIILTSLMHTSTYVGGTLSLTTFRVEDNNTPANELTVIREMILPSGKFQEIPAGYTKYQFNAVGEYEFRIVVIDKANNVATYSTFISVIEK